MDEAGSGPHNCDDSSLIGLWHSAAWTLGTVWVGRLSRTLTAMQERYIIFRVAYRRVGVKLELQRVVEAVVKLLPENN